MTDDAPSPAGASEPNDAKDAAPTPPPTAFDPDPADEPTAASSPGGSDSSPATVATEVIPPSGTTAVLVADPDTDPSGGRGAGSGDGSAGPIDPEFPTAPTKGGLTAAIVSIGAGLLGAAVVISAARSRPSDKLDWSTYSVGLAATAALLVLAVIGAGAVARRSGGQARGDLVTWPGVVGILATAPMIMIGIGPHHHGKWETYLVGGVIAVLAAIGYVVARRAAFVVTVIAGLAVVYTQAFSDVFGDSFKNQSRIVEIAVGVTAFVVIITVLGWFLPSRAVTGVAVGVAGLVGVSGSMLALFVEREIAGALAPLASMFSGLGGSADQSSSADWHMSMLPKISANPADYTDDVTWIFVLVAILTVLWALAALVSDHSGFKVLAIALPAIAVPLGTAVLAVRHPTAWEGALGGAGAVLVVLALLLARRRARTAEGM